MPCSQYNRKYRALHSTQSAFPPKLAFLLCFPHVQCMCVCVVCRASHYYLCHQAYLRLFWFLSHSSPNCFRHSFAVCRLLFFFQTLFCESPIPGRETFSLNARLTNYLPWRYFCVTKSWKIRNAYKYLHLHNFRIFFFKWKFIVLNVKFEMA